MPHKTPVLYMDSRHSRAVLYSLPEMPIQEDARIFVSLISQFSQRAVTSKATTKH
jgi:hypothetical protein